uniref:C2H2-type domain-containing protein n=1 Tax=Cacopsylla melanoneura TaxID=428564 RepID=A0A8D9ATS5_9HEMI
MYFSSLYLLLIAPNKAHELFIANIIKSLLIPILISPQKLKYAFADTVLFSVNGTQKLYCLTVKDARECQGQTKHNYVCVFCEYHSYYSGHVRGHLRSHIGDKPFKC